MNAELNIFSSKDREEISEIKSSLRRLEQNLDFMANLIRFRTRYLEKLLLDPKLTDAVFTSEYHFGSLGTVKFQDGRISMTTDFIVNEVFGVNARKEVDDPYYFNSMELKKGDTVLDIGANIGVVSVFLAKRFPGIKIEAYEPCRKNFDNLKKILN